MFVLKLFSRLPLRGLYLFSDFVFVIAYYVIGYRKKVVWKNLKNSFPNKAEAELKGIQKRFYKNLCDFAVETIKLRTISKAELSYRMVFKNPEILQPLVDRGQSVILLASHQFNWEWLLAAGSFSLPLTVDFVYQEQRSNLFNDYSLTLRTRFGAYPIKREAVARESIRRKDILRGIAIVADQFPGQGQNKRYWTKFLDQDTAFFFGIGQLAFLTQHPVFYAAITRVKRGFYTVQLQKIAEPPFVNNGHIVVDSYAKATENVIRLQPDGWLWSHNRWKNIS